MAEKGGLAGAAIVATPLLVVGGLIASILLIFGPAQDAGACAPGRIVDLEQIPETPIGAYSGEQLQNAALIMNAASSVRMDRAAQIVGVMTAMGESGLHALDHGTDATPDGRGLFQQPDDGAWGSLEDRMDPTRSATNFFLALQAVPSWTNLEPSVAAYRVQGGADPYRYEAFHADAALVVGTLAGGGEVFCQGGYVVFPLDAGFQMTSPYGYRGQIVPGQTINPFHAAVDLQNWPNPCGQPVYAITGGKVTLTNGRNAAEVSVKSPDGYTVSYLHMYPADVLVEVGDDVTAGQQIGRVGNVQPSTGCHLDLRINAVGTTNQAVADLPRAESNCTVVGGRRYCGPSGFVSPEEFYAVFGIELCPADTCRRTY